MAERREEFLKPLYSPKNDSPRNADFLVVCNPDAADEWIYPGISYVKELGLYHSEVCSLVSMMPKGPDTDLWDLQPVKVSVMPRIKRGEEAFGIISTSESSVRDEDRVQEVIEILTHQVDLETLREVRRQIGLPHDGHASTTDIYEGFLENGRALSQVPPETPRTVLKEDSDLSINW
jgi:hypothetical protein